MTDDVEVVRMYAHGGKKDESHYELADALADDGRSDPWDDTLHSKLLYLANEVELIYEVNTATGEIDLIGAEEHTGGAVGDTDRELTWTPSWDDGQ